MSRTSSKPAPKKTARRASKSDYVIEVWTGGGDQPFFARLCSSRNGQTIAPSEGYSTKQKRSATWKKLAEALKCEIVEIEAPATSAPAPAPAAAPEAQG